MLEKIVLGSLALFIGFHFVALVLGFILLRSTS